MLIDTHCHLPIIVEMTAKRPFSIDDLDAIQNIINEATQTDVQYIINVGTNIQESITSIMLAQKFKNVFASVGVHPSECTTNWKGELNKLEQLLAREKNIIAVGECGLDYHHQNFCAPAQKDAFKAQIELALKYDKALIIHSRDAQNEALMILDEYRNETLRAVFHCFSESADIARAIIERNYYIGFGGSITYPKNTALRAIASTIPLEHIVLETDAPFLPPQPFRGKLNQPSYIAFIAQFLADLRNTNKADIAQQTTSNAMHLFNLKL